MEGRRTGARNNDATRGDKDIEDVLSKETNRANVFALMGDLSISSNASNKTIYERVAPRDSSVTGVSLSSRPLREDRLRINAARLYGLSRIERRCGDEIYGK